MCVDKIGITITCIYGYDICDTYVKKYACVYVGLKVFHDVCIILYTCKSPLYFILVLFLVVVHRGPH